MAEGAGEEGEGEEGAGEEGAAAGNGTRTGSGTGGWGRSSMTRRGK